MLLSRMDAPVMRGGSVTKALVGYIVPVSVTLLLIRSFALVGPVRRTWVRVLIAKPTRVKSESADGAE